MDRVPATMGTGHERGGPFRARSDRGSRAVLGVAGLALLPWLAAAAPAADPPWRIWEDLHRLSELHAGAQGLLRSSHCPTGCRFDRHSKDDWRYISVDGDEGVIFEEAGAGAITRIWMTMGWGVSVPLNPDVRIRVYIDGADEPVVDLPLPELFSGSSPPFVPPLVGHRLDSSGGNYSYVPIPYRQGCRVTLVGAHEERIWFQFNFYRLAAPGRVKSFTGQEDLSAWASLLATQGTNPWRETAKWSSATVEVTPPAPAILARRAGPGTWIALLLDLAPESWPALELILTFDGAERVRMPLTDFFAVGRGGPLPTRSLFVGLDEGGRLYSYFPMPFTESAELALRHLGAKDAPAVKVDWRLADSARVPSPASGIFGTVLSTSEQTEIGVDFPFLELDGQGKWVGLFMELRSVKTGSRLYIEGDERIFIDGSWHPSVYGTGIEDIFNGGFAFDQGPLSKALHGSPYPDLKIDRESATAAYRFMPTDAITFAHRIEGGLEGGPTNDLSMRARLVSYFYQRPESALRRCDALDLGRADSRASHAYSVVGPHAVKSLDGRFEGEPPRSLTASGVYRPPGAAKFVLRPGPGATRFRLRRRFDASLPGQAAEIRVGGALAGRFPPVDVNTDRRWREIDVDLAPVFEPGEELAFTVLASPLEDGGGGTFTEFVYELWADCEAGDLSYGFESGDTSEWSSTRGP